MGGPIPTAPTLCSLRDAPPPSRAAPSPLGPVLQLGLGTAMSDPTKSMTVVTWISITGRSTCPLLPPRCVRAHGLCHSHTAPSAVPLSPVPNGLCHSHLFPRVVPVPKGCLRVTHPHGCLTVTHSHGPSQGPPCPRAVPRSPVPTAPWRCWMSITAAGWGCPLWPESRGHTPRGVVAMGRTVWLLPGPGQVSPCEQSR